MVITKKIFNDDSSIPKDGEQIFGPAEDRFSTNTPQIQAQLARADALEGQNMARNGNVKKYVTDTRNGVWVTPQDAKPNRNGTPNSNTTGWRISDALELFRKGISVFKTWFEEPEEEEDEGSTMTRIGVDSDTHILLKKDGIVFYANNSDEELSEVSSFGDHIELGKKFNNENACHNIEVDPIDGLIFNSGNDEVGRLGYSLLNSLSLEARYGSGRTSKLFQDKDYVLLNIDDTNGQLAWGIEITATGEIYLDGASIFMTGNKTFMKVETKTFNASISSQSSPVVSHDVDDEPGYTPIGVVGFDIDSANAGYFRLLGCNLSGNNVYFQVRNDSTSDISATFWADVLYLSN